MTSTSTFYSLSGEKYKLDITGANVVSRTLLLASDEPVVISYSKPQVKFSGLRTVTCKIKIVANENMSDLCASNATENKVVVSRISYSTDGDIITQILTPVFSGYIIPFQYNTPFTLSNDVIEIEAVDLISASKFKYWNWPEKQTVLSPLQYLMRICYPLGITKIVRHDNYGIKDSPVTACDNLSSTSIPTQAFLPENLTDEPDISLTEVVSAISQFFGYIALNLGDALYLYDPHCLLNGYSGQNSDATVSTLISATLSTSIRSTGQNSALYAPISIAAYDFCNTDTTFSIEKPYGKINIDMKDTGIYMILPDILKNAKPYSGATLGGIIKLGKKIKTQYTSNLLNLVYADWMFKDEAGNIMLNAQSANISDIFRSIYATPTSFRGAYGTLLKRYTFNEGVPSYSEEKAVVLQHSNAGDGAVVFQISRQYLGYMRAGMKFSLSGQIEATNSQRQFPSSYVSGQTPISGPQVVIGLKFGYEDTSKAYVYEAPDDPESFSSGEFHEYELNEITLAEDAPVLFGTEDQTSRKNNQSRGDAYDLVDASAWKDQNISHSGSVNIFLQVQPIAGGRTFFLFGLEIKLRGLSLEDKKTSLEAILDASNNETLTIETGLLYASDTNLKRVLLSSTLKGTYCSLGNNATSTTPFTGALMTQVVARYAQKRESYEMSVDCDVKPWSVVAFDGKNFTVDAMEWNLANDEKRILIN